VFVVDNTVEMGACVVMLIVAVMQVGSDEPSAAAAASVSVAVSGGGGHSHSRLQQHQLAAVNNLSADGSDGVIGAGHSHGCGTGQLSHSSLTHR